MLKTILPTNIVGLSLFLNIIKTKYTEQIYFTILIYYNDEQLFDDNLIRQIAILCRNEIIKKGISSTHDIALIDRRVKPYVPKSRVFTFMLEKDKWYCLEQRSVILLKDDTIKVVNM